jgi:D-aminopeptidase
MKVYVSVDMEGIAGVSHPGPTGRADRDYPAAVELMIGETNAAVEGALAGGATEVVVNDSHGGMHNLTPEKVHPAARLVQGQKAYSMVEAGARRAVERAVTGDPTLTTLVLPAPIRVGIDFARPAQADYVAVMPGVRREGDRGVVYEATDGVEAFRAFVCAVRLAGLVAD